MGGIYSYRPPLDGRNSLHNREVRDIRKYIIKVIKVLIVVVLKTVGAFIKS